MSPLMDPSSPVATTGTGMTDGPDACGDVGDRNKHEAVQAEGCERIPRFHAVGLAVSAQHNVDGQQREQPKGVEANIGPIPRCPPLSCSPDAS